MTNLKTLNLVLNIHRPKEARTANRRLAKKRVQWLNEALCFYSSSVLVDSFVLRNPPEAKPENVSGNQNEQQNMKGFILLFTIVMFGCSSKTDDLVTDNNNSSELQNKSLDSIIIDEDRKRFRDSLYNRESENFISKLEEIPGRDSNTYKLTIASKNGKIKFEKILNTRPQRSSINYCNDLYTVVGFSCGGPCYTQVFVFTDQNRPPEQFSYGQRVNGYPNIIVHIREEGDEYFEKLYVRNLLNGKELKVDISDGHLINYGHMDTIYIVKNDLVIIYPSNKRQKKKLVNIESILK